MRRLVCTLLPLALAACSASETGTNGPRLVRGGSETETPEKPEENAPAVETPAEQTPAPETPAATEPTSSGEATYYYYSSGGACGLDPPADLLVAAINDEQYSTENCGRCAQVKGPKGTVIVTVLDKCPGCDSGDLDLSEQAFEKIASTSAGRVQITWSFVDCPK